MRFWSKISKRINCNSSTHLINSSLYPLLFSELSLYLYLSLMWVQLYRCWWQLLETKCVGDVFDYFGHQHLLSLYISVGYHHSKDVTIIEFWWSKVSHQHQQIVANFKSPSPASLPPWVENFECTSFAEIIGYIDVSDGCWGRNVLPTILRCWWRF